MQRLPLYRGAQRLETIFLDNCLYAIVPAGEKKGLGLGGELVNTMNSVGGSETIEKTRASVPADLAANANLGGMGQGSNAEEI